MEKYRNKIFEGECISYAIIGYTLIKKNNNLSLYLDNISVKKYQINFNENDNIYDKYHYFIEFTYNNKIYILDNDNLYTKYEYKILFKPKKVIKLKVKDINNMMNTHTTTQHFCNLIVNDIITQFTQNKDIKIFF